MRSLVFFDLALAQWLVDQPGPVLLKVLHALERECSSRGHVRTMKLLADAQGALLTDLGHAARERPRHGKV